MNPSAMLKGKNMNASDAWVPRAGDYMEKILIVGEVLEYEKDVCALLIPEGYEVEVISTYDASQLKKQKRDLILSEIPEQGVGI